MIFRQQTVSAALATAALSVLVASPACAQLLGPATTTTATQLKWVSDEPGHQLITPYFSTQGDNNTLLSYVNTDRVNGKLLKVRFRGAGNGDTLLDLVVLLGPEDVLTVSLSQGDDGITRIRTPDKSCTLPALPAQGVSMDTARLQSDLGADSKAMHTREGLVEAINMADVVYGSALYTAIRPVAGAAPCTADALAPLTQLGAITSEAQAVQFGLAPPSGGLMGSWQIIRLSNYASYSGRQSAVAALDAQGERAAANWAFAPQLAQAAGDAAKLHTTDPVLTANGLQWSDLPDLSTPLLGKSAISQVNELVAGIAAARVLNEFVSQSEDAGVPAATDWVISLPMRRYSAAYDHATKAMVYAPGHEHWRLSGVLGRRQLGQQLLGSFFCARTSSDSLGWRDREGESRAEVSELPGTSAGLCGNVFVVTIDGQTEVPSAVLQARLTTFNRRTNSKVPAKAGWNRLDIHWPGPGSQLSPSGVLGFAATSLRNKDQNGNYGSVVPHVRLRD